MTYGTRRCHHGGRAQALDRICLVSCLLGCLMFPHVRAQGPVAEPERNRARALVERLDGKTQTSQVAAAGASQPALLERGTAADERVGPRVDESGKAPRNTINSADASLASVRAAVERALPPLQKSLVVYAEKRDCFSCHNQTVPLVALKIARARGLTIDEDAFKGAVELTLADLESALNDYRKGQGQPGGATRAAYALWALELGNHPPDPTTGAVVEFLLGTDRARDHWTTSSRRWPMEASHFTTTALALRGLRAFAAKGQSDVVKDRVAQARSWLAKSPPADTEDRVFRLWGLKSASASPEEIKPAVNELLASQRTDGGWAQIDRLASDPYATGSALVALHEAGGFAADDPAYRRGLAFLVGSQKNDGTWFVASRSKPFQPYFESGFPYGKDQFIAVAASGWATAALALALPTVP
jgi:hypothetical protein